MGRSAIGRKQTCSTQSSGWLWLPVIFGLIIGATVTAMTDQWWWTTVGVLVGAAVGAVSAGKLRSAGQSSGTSRSISSSQVRADMSDGARQSPRGDSDPPADTLGPLGSAERLN